MLKIEFGEINESRPDGFNLEAINDRGSMPRKESLPISMLQSFSFID